MIVIMGPGRCGTTFWIRLFQELGFDTGGCHEIFREKRTEIRDPSFKWPYVIKGTGTLCVDLDRWVERCKWKVDYVYLCFRALEPNVRSMIKKKRGQGDYKGLTEEQLEKRIREEIPRGYDLARSQISNYAHSEVEFPRSALNREYAYECLSKSVSVDFDKFVKVWNKVRDDKLIRFG